MESTGFCVACGCWILFFPSKPNECPPSPPVVGIRLYRVDRVRSPVLNMIRAILSCLMLSSTHLNPKKFMLTNLNSFYQCCFQINLVSVLTLIHSLKNKWFSTKNLPGSSKLQVWRAAKAFSPSCSLVFHVAGSLHFPLAVSNFPHAEPAPIHCLGRQCPSHSFFRQWIWILIILPRVITSMISLQFVLPSHNHRLPSALKSLFRMVLIQKVT